MMERDKSNVSISSMLKSLNELYDREEIIIEEIRRLYQVYEQLEQDKELLQTIIMHQSNKNDK